jgi:hypothetical protein
MKCLLTIAALTLTLLVAVGAAAAAPAAEKAAAVVVEEQDISLFPNPVEGELNVLCKKHDVERLMIFGASGELVFNSPMAIQQGSRLTVNMGLRPAGYYTVKVWVKGAKQPLTFRIVKV